MDSLFSEDVIIDIAMAVSKKRATVDSIIEAKSPKVKEVKKVEEPYPKWAAYHRIVEKRIAWLKETLEAIFGEDYDVQLPVISIDTNRRRSIENSLHSVNEETDEILFTNLDNFAFVYYTAIVRYPEITVSERNSKHTMKEVYIKFDFYYSGQMIRPVLARAKRSLAEHKNSYTFSHGQKTTHGGWVTLCFGRTDLDTDIVSLYQNWDALKFEGVIHQFKDYLSWESSAGGPYTSIHELVARSGTRSFNMPNANTMDAYYRSIISDVSVEIPILNRSSDKLAISVDANNRDFWRALGRFVGSEYKFPINEVTNRTFIDATDNVENRRLIERVKRDMEGHVYFRFRGKDIGYTLEGMEEKASDKERFVHEQIRDSLVAKLNKKITKYYLNEFHNIG